MNEFIKKNIFIIVIFFVTLFVGFLTFLTFLDKSFVPLNDKNLKILLITDILLLLIFFATIFIDIKNLIKNNINVKGSVANRKYIVFFSLLDVPRFIDLPLITSTLLAIAASSSFLTSPSGSNP